MLIWEGREDPEEKPVRSKSRQVRALGILTKPPGRAGEELQRPVGA